MTNKNELTKKIDYLNYLISKNEDIYISNLMDYKEYILDVSIEEYESAFLDDLLGNIGKKLIVYIDLDLDIFSKIEHINNVLKIDIDKRIAHYREHIIIFGENAEDFKNFDKFVLNNELSDIIDSKEKEKTRRKI